MTRRLLAISAVDHPGGAEIHLLRLVAGLRSRGWEIMLTTPGPGPLAEQARSLGCGWQQLPLGGLARGAGTRALSSWPRARALSRRTDVAYLNGTVAARARPALPRTVRRVLHVHDMVGRAPAFWRRADLTLADSDAVARRLRELGGPTAKVVYGPVDPDPPTTDPPWRTAANGHAGSHALVVGFVGRIERRKGPLDLVRAAPAIRRELPDARVVIIGGDPYGSDPEYTRAVRESDHVELCEWTDNAPGVMRHLDVLVLPSYEEPFGTVLAEAMAVGTPVVATAVDGLPEVVQDGVSGRLVPPGNPEALAGAVIEVLGRREQMGAAAREHARRFHVEAYVERVERLLLDVGTA